MQVVRVRLSAKAFFFPSFTVFGLLFCFLMVFNLFFTYWLVSLYSYGWLFTATRVVAINVFLVCYRKLLCSWPNFKRHWEFFLSEFFSRFVAYPVPSPQIVGTSRKQGEGKIRPAWYWEGGSAPFLSSVPARQYLHQFHIAEHYYLGAWNKLFVAWQEWQFLCSTTWCSISAQRFASIHVQYSPLVQVLKP